MQQAVAINQYADQRHDPNLTSLGEDGKLKAGEVVNGQDAKFRSDRGCVEEQQHASMNSRIGRECTQRVNLRAAAGLDTALSIIDPWPDFSIAPK
jgi:hypothetical protein